VNIVFILFSFILVDVKLKIDLILASFEKLKRNDLRIMIL